LARENILIVEDEKDILELIKYSLGKEGYQVTGLTSGEEALKAARLIKPDLIVLDLMLPGLDGLEICKILKNDSRTGHIPIIMLTAKGEDSDIVAGLEVGADDYVTKPFSPKVLIARIRAFFRRKAKDMRGDDSIIKIHEFNIHPGRHEVLVNDKPIELTMTEFGILHFLARRPGWVYNRYEIVNGVRGEDSIVTDRSVDVQIVGLRKKLGAAGKYIETVRGIGYRFRE
jgi:two-component system alkaline phosphatase synthesis response regulator PhoP